MPGLYGRVRNGSLTGIRYLGQHLKFNDSLAIILATGDQVIPLIDDDAPNIGTAESPLYRDPTEFELTNALTTAADIDRYLYRYDLDRANGVAALDDNGDINDSALPNTVTTYRGLYNPGTNTPALVDGVGDLGDIYQIADGFPNDVTVNFGGEDMVVRTGTRIEYREDNKWHSVGFLVLNKAERRLLDSALVATTPYDYDGSKGSEQGAYGIAVYPEILETLKGGLVVAQLVPTNTPHGEIFCVNNGGLDSLSLNDVTGELFVTTSGYAVGVYNPTFIVGCASGRSELITIPIEIIDYTLVSTEERLNLQSGTAATTVVTSPQNEAPTLVVVNDGGLWDVTISEDDGATVNVDAFCCTSGEYEVVLQAVDGDSESDPLTIPVSVYLADGQIEPTWDKVSLDQSGLTPTEVSAIIRGDYSGVDAPLDYTV